jgi:hypothetical protein
MLQINGITYRLNAFVRVNVRTHRPDQCVPGQSICTRELPQDRYDRFTRQQRNNHLASKMKPNAGVSRRSSRLRIGKRGAMSAGASLRVDEHTAGCMARLDIAFRAAYIDGHHGAPSIGVSRNCQIVANLAPPTECLKTGRAAPEAQEATPTLFPSVRVGAAARPSVHCVTKLVATGLHSDNKIS